MDSLLTSLHSFMVLLLDYPDEFRIDCSQGQSSAVITVHSHKNDISKIVGKAGRNINALKILISAIGAKNGLRVHLIIQE